ncbi:malic enzyme-like NAD(P)-binding protein, partial [Actinacidiphila oryziradicis]|uniref:malic enzyme-like NAD(P)-binding protein n=1 Tax=Actinacidiphila oryziradicis TaxID=2571141 RepID=UPI0023F187E5
YVFPAIGLAVTAGRATRVTDRMMVAAARALGRYAARAADQDGPAPLLPPLKEMRDVAREIAVAAALAAVEDGVAPDATEAELRSAVNAAQWEPEYPA